MKKIIAIVLALVLSLSLVACGGSSEPAKTAENAAIAAYVEANKADLIAEMEESFATSSGLTCTSDIKVEGMGFIITMNINEMDNVDDATKQLLQETFDSMQGSFDLLIESMQSEVPGIEYFQVVINEVDGDHLVTITAGDK
jgi:hypothetical protein